MKISDKRVNGLVRYKDLNNGDVFIIYAHGEEKICMKTTLAIDWYGEDCEIHGLKKDDFGRYKQEFAVNLRTGLHFDVEPDKEVRKLNAELIVKD